MLRGYDASRWSATGMTCDRLVMLCSVMLQPWVPREYAYIHDDVALLTVMGTAARVKVSGSSPTTVKQKRGKQNSRLLLSNEEEEDEAAGLLESSNESNGGPRTPKQKTLKKKQRSVSEDYWPAQASSPAEATASPPQEASSPPTPKEEVPASVLSVLAGQGNRPLETSPKLADQSTSATPGAARSATAHPAGSVVSRSSTTNKSKLISKQSKQLRKSGKSKKHHRPCTCLHVPYGLSTAPFGNMRIVQCGDCGHGWVPEVVLATVEPPRKLSTRGGGTLVEARVLRVLER